MSPPVVLAESVYSVKSNKKYHSELDIKYILVFCKSYNQQRFPQQGAAVTGPATRHSLDRRWAWRRTEICVQINSFIRHRTIVRLSFSIRKKINLSTKR